MSERHWQDCGNGIYCIDTGLFREGLAACYLLVRDGEAAFVDTGTKNSLPRLKAVLADLKLKPEQVRWVLPTHVHLDHAGGAGVLMEYLPAATLLVHHRGARHLIDPARLQAGALAVYGESRFESAFGQLQPVADQRVVQAEDGHTIQLGDTTLTFFDTPGHARHHYVVHDPVSSGLFTGDTFGVSYPELNTGRRRFIFPPSTPVQFDPQAWHHSLTRLLALKPDRVFLTHFGMHENPHELGEQLSVQIDYYVNLTQQLFSETQRAKEPPTADDLTRTLAGRLMQHSLNELAARQCPVAPALIRQALAGDMELNAQGLVHWALQSAKGAHTA